MAAALGAIQRLRRHDHSCAPHLPRKHTEPPAQDKEVSEKPKEMIHAMAIDINRRHFIYLTSQF
jgi:hypothetical protein